MPFEYRPEMFSTSAQDSALPHAAGPQTRNVERKWREQFKYDESYCMQRAFPEAQNSVGTCCDHAASGRVIAVYKYIELYRVFHIHDTVPGDGVRQWRSGFASGTRTAGSWYSKLQAEYGYVEDVKGLC
jgi:hypothetical protein